MPTAAFLAELQAHARALEDFCNAHGAGFVLLFVQHDGTTTQVSNLAEDAIRAVAREVATDEGSIVALPPRGQS
jgi:hypothetical protein